MKTSQMATNNVQVRRGAATRGAGKGGSPCGPLLLLMGLRTVTRLPTSLPEAPAALGVTPLLETTLGLSMRRVGRGSHSPQRPPSSLTGASSGNPQGCCERSFCSSPALPEPIPLQRMGGPSLALMALLPHHCVQNERKSRVLQEAGSDTSCHCLL